MSVCPRAMSVVIRGQEFYDLQIYVAISWWKLGVDFVPADVTKVQYDITLLHWLKVEDVSGDRGVMKKVLREGDGWETPNEGAFVSVNIEYRVVTNGVAGDVVIKHEPFIFTVIDGAVAEGTRLGPTL